MRPGLSLDSGAQQIREPIGAVVIDRSGVANDFEGGVIALVRVISDLAAVKSDILDECGGSPASLESTVLPLVLVMADQVETLLFRLGFAVPFWTRIGVCERACAKND